MFHDVSAGMFPFSFMANADDGQHTQKIGALKNACCKGPEQLFKPLHVVRMPTLRDDQKNPADLAAPVRSPRSDDRRPVRCPVQTPAKGL